jgi:hypothetical protein
MIPGERKGLISLSSHDGRSPKITFGEMGASGVRDVPIFCRDHRCGQPCLGSSVHVSRKPAEQIG